MPIAWNEVSEKSNGGTENMARKLERDLPKELLDQFQIIPSRVRELDPTKIRILWLHDLPGDPESDHLKNEGWKKFHKIVFVSHWQRDWYIRHYGIPYSHCTVIQNAVEPLEMKKEDISSIRLIYHTTPHRGLELLVPVFEKLHEKHPEIYLDVFSSFKAYGWKDRDKPYEKLFNHIDRSSIMSWHEFKPNEEVRGYLEEAHIFAYPSIWMETSCIALMEAMSAGCVCVHPNYGALSETSANWTLMYDYNEDMNKHASSFYNILDVAIEAIKEDNESFQMKLKGQKSYADLYYNWEIRKAQWQAFLQHILNQNPSREIPETKQMFTYSVK